MTACMVGWVGMPPIKERSRRMDGRKRLITIGSVIAVIALVIAIFTGASARAAASSILTGEGPLCDGHQVCVVYSHGTIVTEPSYKAEGNQAAEWKQWWYGTTSWNLFDKRYWNFIWSGHHLRKRMVTYQNVKYPDWCLGGYGKTVFPVLCRADQNGWIQADGALYEIRNTGPPPDKPEIPGALTSLTSFGPAWVLTFADTAGQKWSIT